MSAVVLIAMTIMAPSYRTKCRHLRGEGMISATFRSTRIPSHLCARTVMSISEFRETNIALTSYVQLGDRYAVRGLVSVLALQKGRYIPNKLTMKLSGVKYLFYAPRSG